MSYSSALQSLEKLLESFLERAVNAKGSRLQILDGINRLDDIARTSGEGQSVIENIGEWFADHSNWLEGNGLRPSDIGRISRILTEIDNSGLSQFGDPSPATSKIRSELERWTKRTKATSQKAVLRRGSEITTETTRDSIALFDQLLEKLSNFYHDLSDSKKHILSVLEHSLQLARTQKSKDALLLSAFIIYYLKQSDYKIGPYVRRLKEAETACREEKRDA